MTCCRSWSLLEIKNDLRVQIIAEPMTPKGTINGILCSRTISYGDLKVSIHMRWKSVPLFTNLNTFQVNEMTLY